MTKLCPVVHAVSFRNGTVREAPQVDSFVHRHKKKQQRTTPRVIMAKFTPHCAPAVESPHPITPRYHPIDRKYWTACVDQDKLDGTAFLDAQGARE